MTMSWMLHTISLGKVETLLSLNLEKIVKSWLILLVITSSNHIELSIRTIDGLEIMWELMSGLALENLA